MTESENGCTNESEKDSKEFGLDAILTRIGEFGRFQIFTYMKIMLPIVFNAILMCSYIFVAGSVVHRCRVPECDGPDSSYQEPWTDFSIPVTSGGVLDDCHRHIPYNRSTEMCFAENFDQKSQESCGKDFIFRDNELSISNDFDIYCLDEWKLSLVGTINVAGQTIGTPLGGFFSDRYGRRSMLAIGGFLSALLGIIRSFSVDYYMFLVLGFLENLFGGVLYATLFIIGLELVGQKARVLTGATLPMFYSIGEVLLTLGARNVSSWRWVLRIFYIPALAHIFLLWTLPESIRWLLTQGKEEEVAKILKKAAKTNKRKLSDATIDKLFLENRQKVDEVSQTKSPVTKALKVFPWRIINCSVCWFSNVLVYHGLNLNSQLLGGNKYDSFMYLALCEIPAYTILYFTMNKFGRRYSLFGYMLICGICLGATVFTTKEQYAFQLSMFLIGKMAITISFQVLYFFTSEIFPTNVRNSMLSLCSMFGRIGAMVGPQTLLLAKYYESAPEIMFSLCAILSAFMSLMFPETTNATLPSTIEEAEEIGRKKKKVEEGS